MINVNVSYTMAANSLIDPATKKFYPDLVPEGGGVALQKGQLITANAAGIETAFPPGAAPPNGSILSYDATAPLGLAYIAVPGAIPLAQGQLISADLAGAATIVVAPNLPAQANYVLSADGTAGAAGTNMLWKPPTGAGGLINATAPLVDDAGVGTNTISINFTASIGEIPYGTGVAKTGALTNAPAAGQILGVSAGVPAWIAAGGSGTVTANLPLVESAGVGNSSLVSIGFSAAYGEIPYGTGTANIGTLLAPPAGAGAVGKVLTYTGIVQGQPPLSWTTPTTPVGSDTIIVRSSGQSNLVPVPTDQNTQLVLVAENLAASWDLYSQTSPQAPIYKPEFYFSSADGTKNYLATSYEDGPHGRGCNIWYVDGVPANSVFIGSFTFEIDGGSPAANAQIFCACNGKDPYSATNFFAGTALQDKIMIGGKFNRYVAANTSPILKHYGICLLNTLTNSIDFISTDASKTVFGFTNANDPVNDTTATIRSIVALPANALNWLQTQIPQAGIVAPGVLIGGTFDTLYQEDSTGANISVTGYSALALLYIGGPSPAGYYFPPLADVIELGFYVNDGPPQPNAGCQGQINKILFSPTYDKFWLSGDVMTYLIANDTGGLAAIQPDNNAVGFLVYQNPGILGGNAWAENLPGTAVIPTFNTNDTRDIAFSSALVNHIILAGPQMAVVDISNPISFVWTAIPPVSPGFEGWYDSILTNISVLTPTGIETGDFVLNVESTGSFPQAIGYFTTATGTTYNVLPPLPTGIDNPAPGGILTNFFRFFSPNSIAISGNLGEYYYDASTHPNIAFTTTPPMFFKAPAGGTPTTATFTGDFQSQSYIASTDKLFWVQVGATNPNLAYT